jgi:hypothetical protein
MLSVGQAVLSQEFHPMSNTNVETCARAGGTAPGMISVDLIRASYRSDDFPKDWTDEKRRQSLDRYERWLRLKQSHPKQRMAPTRDIRFVLASAYARSRRLPS